MRWLAILLLLSTAAVSADTVYKIVHPDGTVEYTSEPQPGAEEVQVPTLPTYESRTPAPPAPPAPEEDQGEAEAKDEGPPDYSISLTEPSAGENVIFDAAGIPVRAAIDPDLRTGEGHQIVFLLDGSERARSSSPSARLVVERGTHTLMARVEDGQGNVLARSPSVTFYLRQHSRRH